MYPPQLTICFRLPAVRPILFKPVEMRLVDTWGRLEGLLEEQNFSTEELTESLGRLAMGGWGWGVGAGGVGDGGAGDGGLGVMNMKHHTFEMWGFLDLR